MTAEEVIEKLRSKADPKNVEGMARFGITAKNTLGIPIPVLRTLAKEIGKSPSFANASAGRHTLAQELWASGIHEARILAAFVDEPTRVTSEQMDAWIKDFDSWDVCDQVCANLFDRTPFAFAKASEWTNHEQEFERRAGFALMAALAWHAKTATDTQFEPFFALIKKYATDERNFVKKSVNWALRQIGKRNAALRPQAITCAESLERMESKSARWIAKDALRELRRK